MLKTQTRNSKKIDTAKEKHTTGLPSIFFSIPSVGDFPFSSNRKKNEGGENSIVLVNFLYCSADFEGWRKTTFFKKFQKMKKWKICWRCKRWLLKKERVKSLKKKKMSASIEKKGKRFWPLKFRRRENGLKI